MSRKSRERRAKRKAAQDFWEGVDMAVLRRKKPAPQTEKVVRIFLHDDQITRVYEDRRNPEQPAKLYYDWRKGSTNRGPQLPVSK